MRITALAVVLYCAMSVGRLARLALVCRALSMRVCAAQACVVRSADERIASALARRDSRPPPRVAHLGVRGSANSVGYASRMLQNRRAPRSRLVWSCSACDATYDRCPRSTLHLLFFFLISRPPRRSPLFPYPTLFR